MAKSAPALLSQLALSLVLFWFASSSLVIAARPLPGFILPGFVFTRNRGRCTPQYWGSRREAWPKMVPQRSTVLKVFGSRVIERFRSDLTLLEAATRNDDVENAYVRLLKQSTAALLNSYARVYPYKAWEVKTMLIQGLISVDSAAQTAQILKLANEACH